MRAKCSVNGCDKPQHARGHCSMHASRLSRGGSLEPTARDRSGIVAHNKAEYRCYRHMIERCNNKNCADYQGWGGRGIEVCARWLEKPYGFRNFLKDMGKRPSGCSIDRINNNKEYSPENCRWATAKEQANNRRVRKDAPMYTYGGETKPLSEWAKITGIPYRKLLDRYHSKTYDKAKLLETKDARYII